MDEAMRDTKSPINDKIKNKIKPTKGKHKPRKARSKIKNYHIIPTRITLGTINCNLIYV